jgi:hypothetical protein
MADAAAAFLAAPPRNYKDVTLREARPCRQPRPNRGVECEMVGVDQLFTIGEMHRDQARFRVAVVLHGHNGRYAWRHEYEVSLVLTGAGRWQVTRVNPGLKT